MSSGGRQVGPWSLGEKLGQGGNGSVWNATAHGESQPVALKLINSKKAHKEPYQRFVREIEFLRQHGSIDGVLPLIDAYLPDEPSSDEQPWLAMPVATPIADALTGRPLEDVVQAMKSIAEAVATLESDLGIAHRDIKPGNLYELEGQWLIGDFGLIALPDAAGLTAAHKPIGPAHYTAYEMMIDPNGANPHLADVYSLGKTIWVLATGQHFPPEGHQPAQSPGFEVGVYRPHPNTQALDRLIDRMTKLQADERPEKSQVALDLGAWLELPGAPPGLDLSSVRQRMKSKISGELAQQDLATRNKELALEAVRRLQERTRPLNDALKSFSETTVVDTASDASTSNTLKSLGGFSAPEVEFRWQRCTVVSPINRVMAPVLRMGRTIELSADGWLILHLRVSVIPEGAFGSHFHWQPETASAPIGSIEAEKLIADGVAEMESVLVEAIEALVDALPQTND